MTKQNIPVARRKQILRWLDEEGALSITELKTRFNISHMTVHRDLDILVTEGLIHKVRGGAVLTQKSTEITFADHNCAMCGNRISDRLEFSLSVKNKEKVSTCCPHCGIMLISNYRKVDLALARDFLYGRMINVNQAYFVVDSDVHICCEPTVICFASKSDANKFSHGFGGRVMDFHKTQTYLTTSHHHLHG